LVMGCGANFLVSPFENMGSCIKHTGTNPRERSQLLILLHKELKGYRIAVDGSIAWHSYGVSLAIRDHPVSPDTSEHTPP